MSRKKMHKAFVIVGGLFLCISAGYGAARLLLPLVGVELSFLAGCAAFVATMFAVDKAYPIASRLPGQHGPP